MDVLNEKLVTIDSLKTRLDGLRPLSGDTEKEIKLWFENITVSISNLGKNCDTKEREILEIAHREALNYIFELSRKNTMELNRADILKIHFILFENICPNFAGKYRDSGNAWVSLKNEEKHKVCDPLLIPDEMNKFFDWLFSEKNEHSLIVAAEAHNKFVSIHPFFDGNGRTGRLLMNLILLKNGYVPVIIKSYKRTEYYDDAIKSWQNGKKEDFYNYIAEREIESLEEYLRRIT